jgi:hypothetical protein
MLRYALIALAAFVLVCASLASDDAQARRGGGGVRAGGFHGGGVRAGGFHGGGVRAARVGGVGVRGGRVAVAGRGYGYRGGAYRAAGYRGAYRGAAYGAAAVGAAAVGAAAYGAYGGYYNNGGCYRDGYGSWVCPNQYQY